jgi:hypothetical protein
MAGQLVDQEDRHGQRPSPGPALGVGGVEAPFYLGDGAADGQRPS